MQTNFTLAQLADPDLSEANTILRACVHCGFCTATCPTYVQLGDELDGPRGRIYLMKELLETGKPATADVVTHIDRCLSCLSCMTTCPSGVHYMHLVDQARYRIEETYRRPWLDRVLRQLLGWIMPYPTRFRWAMLGARLVKPLSGALPGRIGAMARLAPAQIPPPSAWERAQFFPAEGARRKRVALLAGCVQQVLDPAINEATIRLLTRHGCDVSIVDGTGCCGSLTHHLGQDSHRFIKGNIDAWTRAIEGEGLDAIVINTSGCGTTVKDYGYMLRADPAYAGKAARVSALAKDVTELMAELGLDAVTPNGMRVAYHSACSMQHGQRIHAQPRALLVAAGFAVSDIPEGHLCCGSAGTYNMLQSGLADPLRARKLANIASTGAEIVATGNIGCIEQLDTPERPVLHTVELLDWATGGPMPPQLRR